MGSALDLPLFFFFFHLFIYLFTWTPLLRDSPSSFTSLVKYHLLWEHSWPIDIQYIPFLTMSHFDFSIYSASLPIHHPWFSVPEFVCVCVRAHVCVSTTFLIKMSVFWRQELVCLLTTFSFALWWGISAVVPCFCS
jgi:hypothetical protein